MNKDAAVEKLMLSDADEDAAEHVAKAEAAAAEYVHRVSAHKAALAHVPAMLVYSRIH